jgi:hypothetical protein
MVTNKMKIMAIFFIVLMFGSTFAYGIMNLLGQENNQTQIPQDKILNYRLTDEQRNYLMQKGYTLIEYDYSSGCVECIDVKSNLERITQNSDGQIYLQEIISEGANRISIVSLNGQKTINKPTLNQTQEDVCNLLLQRPIFCISGQI